MTTKKNILICALLCAGTLFWAGCNDDFLKEKTNYNNLSPDIYNDYTGADMRLQNLYLRIQPSAREGLGFVRAPVSNGFGDAQTQATEEFTGLSWYVDPTRELTEGPGVDWFHVSKATNDGPWGNIRNCNDFIEGVSAGTLTQEEKDELLGQAYFLRSWIYYLLVRTYGGVPIIDQVQATDVSQSAGLTLPRSTTRECIGFICSSLDKAAEMLPFNWPSSDFGRVTKGTALALKGRIRLLYASPLFNRADDKARWQVAYDVNKGAIDTLGLGNFGLAYANNPGVNASGFSRMFSDYNSEEAVFVTLYNMVHDNNAAEEYWRNNSGEQRMRPYNASGTGSGGVNASALMVDLFPMADGLKPGRSEYVYNPLTFFENRDPRFYRTFAFPGVYWRFEGDPTVWRGDAGNGQAPYKGPEYVLWNYAWYASEERRSDTNISGYAPDMLQNSYYRGVFLRKRSNDFDLNPFAPTRLYRWPDTQTENRAGAFGESAAPLMEIRFAEVLLNFAEAACGIGQYQEAIDQLVKIRMRAGYTEAQARAAFADAAGDRARVFAAILYERQIELAYEGKRFEDMRRWLLWDGGTKFGTVEGAPSSWTLTGFGGNTCTYLGVEPFNGINRNNFELATQVFAVEAAATVDPLASLRPAPLDLKNELTAQFPALAEFYKANLIRKVRRGDATDNNGIGRTVDFKPRNYLLGLNNSAQNNNITLLQTIGWPDVMNGNAGGTFDPLAE